MLARMRRSAGEASSLIAPFGSTERRIAASRSRKSPSDAARAASKGNCTASSRNCWRSPPEISSNDAASRNSGASSTAPGPRVRSSQASGSASPPKPSSRPGRSHCRAPRISAKRASRSTPGSSASTARRPGAQVVLRRSNSRSLSNSNTSCAERDISSLLQLLEQMMRHVARCSGDAHQAPLGLAPGRQESQFDLAHSLEDGLPEIAKHDERFRFHHRLVEHLPDHRQLDERARSTFAGDESIGEANQFEQALLPCRHTHFHINPGIRWGGEKVRRHAVGFPTRLFGAARNPGHHPAVTTATNRETVFRQSPSALAGLFIVWSAFLRARAAKYGDNGVFAHLRLAYRS